MKILVCGGAGFIGSAFIRNNLKNNPNNKITNLDALLTGSNLSNLKSVESYENYKFVKGNIKDEKLVKELVANADLVVNFAAESHVDRSIANPKPFIETNVIGTYTILEAIREFDKKLVHISTDEVYGDTKGSESFTENSLIEPSNPYSATKASSDHLVSAYHRTYGIKCITTRCTNNFGPHQFPEKLIPKTIIRAKKNLKIPLYGDGNQIRSWIYVDDHVHAIEKLIHKGKHGERYNITAWNEISNRTIVENILEILNKSQDLIEYVGDRPGHDKRYSIDAQKIQKEVGWEPKFEFKKSLENTVKWYEENQEWWEPLINEQSIHPQPWTLNWK